MCPGGGLARLHGFGPRGGLQATSMASLCCSILQLTHVEYFDRSVEALEDEFAYCFQLRQRFDLGVHFCIDQNLAIERLIAEAGGEICDRSGHGILETSLVANASECRIAVGGADTEAKIMAVSLPLGGYLCDSVAHLKSHFHSPCRWSGTWQRIVEQDHDI